MKLNIILGALLLASAAASISIIRSAWGTIDTQKAEIADLRQTITGLQKEYNERIEYINRLQANQRDTQQQINIIKQKALKDVTRVEKITKEKSKLYENLVNRDHQKTQNEFSEISK